MRNARLTPARRIFITIALAAFGFLAGCVDTAYKQRLNEGYQALDAQRYDEAGLAANEFLAKHPTGPGAAEAFYLQGRAYEQRALEAHESVATAKGDLDAARAAYVKGLTLQTSPKVQALLHSGLANVTYFQEEYSIAINEWQAAMPNLVGDDAKAWALYRIGLSQQRLGWFKQADETFAAVQQHYPSSEAATRSGTRVGAKAFYVQIGAYSDPNNARKVVDGLQRAGLPGSTLPEAPNRSIVRIGPASTYADAKSLRSRIAGEYPQAVILP